MSRLMCPTGFICINHINALGGLTIILLVLYIFNKEIYSKLYNKLDKIEHTQKYKEQESVQTQNALQHKNFQPQALPPARYDVQQENSQEQEEMVTINRDDMALKNPLMPPLSRNYRHDLYGTRTIPKGAVPINIETRGSGGDYQQIGILYKDAITDGEKEPGSNTDSNILPLFGKPTYKGSSQWNYYTATDKYNQIKVPITIDNNNCTDERGCKEINEGDSISIPAYNGNFKANIYKLESPRYIPNVY